MTDWITYDSYYENGRINDRGLEQYLAHLKLDAKLGSHTTEKLVEVISWLEELKESRGRIKKLEALKQKADEMAHSIDKCGGCFECGCKARDYIREAAKELDDES